MKNLEFYQCENCQYLKVEVEDTNESCDNNDLLLLTPNTSEGAIEKHMPVATFDGDNITVTIGAILHPMTEEHMIAGIYIVTDTGIITKKDLTSEDQPCYTFKIDDATVVDVYVYCNLHGVWKDTFHRS